ncbi:MAG: NADP-dependent oxidoreductase [Actinomycetia bacterium]|nr:NADP-dependent oxidoreductase [Actinomycetes bacterium]
MRAAVVEAFGEPGVISVRDVPIPEPAQGQIRIKVVAAGINPVDTYNAKDPSWAGIATGCILGYDIAGTVEAVGHDVSSDLIGRNVMAMTAFPQGQGGYAEYAVVDEPLAAYLPDDADLVAAASVPLAAGTAWEVLEKLEPAGPLMLVIGGSGGVGLFLIQLAAARGVHVVAMGQERSHAVMHAHGATTCVDYRSPDAIATAVDLAGGPFDSIAELVGGPLTALAQPHLRDDGVIAAIAPPDLAIDALIDANQSLHGILIRDNSERLRHMADLFSGGHLRTHVTRVLPLDEVAEAHRLVDSGEAGGKVVLTP